MNLLCGTDFSPNANEAVNAAAVIARQFRDTLTLVHASAPPADDGIGPEVWSPVEAALGRQLEEQAAPVRATGLPVRTRLEPGTTVEVMERLGEPGSSRMIVLSSIGRVALARVLLGSTADRVAESASIPTLVVRRGMVFSAWAEGRRPLRILVAADFSTASDAALEFARDWARSGPVDLVVGHVADPARERERRRMDPHDEQGGSLRTALERDLQERAGLFLDGVSFTLAVELSAEEPSAVLIELAKENQADLIVTGTHQTHGVRRLWHHSMSRSLLADAPMNVAVVPGTHRGTPGPVPPLHRVLVTTDLSPVGNRAIPAACALLGHGGTLRVLHILQRSDSGTRRTGGRPKELPLSPGEQAAKIRHVNRMLTRLVPADAASRGIAVEARTLIADPVAVAVLREALGFGAHTICMSSRGRGAALQALLGSVAQKVMERSPVPVHLVPPPRN